MTEDKPRYGVDAYLDWVAKEGLPVVEHFPLVNGGLRITLVVCAIP